MSDPISQSAYFKAQRQCAWCHTGISDRRPVFLVSDGTGQIVGPFHAGCAERLRLEVKKKGAAALGNGDSYHLWGRIPREETLPE